MARVGAALASGGAVDGVRLLPERFFDAVLEEQIYGDDLVLGLPVRWGLGVGLPSKEMPLPSPRSFYWGGWGGSLCLIDLDAKRRLRLRHEQDEPHHDGRPARARPGGGGLRVAAGVPRGEAGESRAAGIRERARAAPGPAGRAPHALHHALRPSPVAPRQIVEREDQRRADGARQEVGG